MRDVIGVIRRDGRHTDGIAFRGFGLGVADVDVIRATAGRHEVGVVGGSRVVAGEHGGFAERNIGAGRVLHRHLRHLGQAVDDDFVSLVGDKADGDPVVLADVRQCPRGAASDCDRAGVRRAIGIISYHRGDADGVAFRGFGLGIADIDVVRAAVGGHEVGVVVGSRIVAGKHGGFAERDIGAVRVLNSHFRHFGEAVDGDLVSLVGDELDSDPVVLVDIRQRPGRGVANRRARRP